MRTTKRIIVAGFVSILAFGVVPAQAASAATGAPGITAHCCRG